MCFGHVKKIYNTVTRSREIHVHMQCHSAVEGAIKELLSFVATFCVDIKLRKCTSKSISPK